MYLRTTVLKKKKKKWKIRNHQKLTCKSDVDRSSRTVLCSCVSFISWSLARCRSALWSMLMRRFRWQRSSSTLRNCSLAFIPAPIDACRASINDNPCSSNVVSKCRTTLNVESRAIDDNFPPSPGCPECCSFRRWRGSMSLFMCMPSISANATGL